MRRKESKLLHGLMVSRNASARHLSPRDYSHVTTNHGRSDTLYLSIKSTSQGLTQAHAHLFRNPLDSVSRVQNLFASVEGRFSYANDINFPIAIPKYPGQTCSTADKWQSRC